ncbi:hypothetical protein MRX96_054712 [Rhipicephalus microplus]
MLLDEPYSDVEPLYRNEIIHMLQLLKSSQATSIIMTSHRMTHCEVLCDRVGVMEAGKVEALGDALQMNQKYGRSYMVTLRLPLDKRFDYYFQRSHDRLDAEGVPPVHLQPQLQGHDELHRGQDVHQLERALHQNGGHQRTTRNCQSSRFPTSPWRTYSWDSLADRSSLRASGRTTFSAECPLESTLPRR